MLPEHGNPHREPPHSPPGRPQRKSGLEAPLEGRYLAERKVLTFAPPRWYDILVVSCFAFATYCFFLAYFGSSFIDRIPFATAQSGGYWFLLGVAVALAGVWAMMSHDRLTCDLRKGTFRRVLGRRIVRGQLSDLAAVVVLAEPNPLTRVGSVVYRSVLHWKGERLPILVLDTQFAPIPMGAPLNANAQPILSRALTYSQLLGVKLYDNSHFASPCPVPLF